MEAGVMKEVFIN